MALHLQSTGINFADFGHGSGSMVNELLSDYEFGTWVPSYSGGSGISRNFNKYCKVADWLYVQSYCSLGVGGNENLVCTNAPFTCPASGYATGIFNGQGGHSTGILIRTVVNDTRYAFYSTINQDSVNISVADNSHLIWSINYTLT